MPSDYETFFTHESYAVVGHSAKSPFPRLAYQGLKARGKKVCAIDTSADVIEGDPAYPSFEAMPDPVQAAILEVPREETADWVVRAADAGIQHVWIHLGRDTPEALSAAKTRGLEVRSGTCAAMYLHGSYHTIHKWINKLRGKY